MTSPTRLFMLPMILLSFFLVTPSVDAAPTTKVKPSEAAPGTERRQLANLIDINSATLADLRSLPGVGTVTAKKIVAGRPYASIDDLKTRNIVPVKTYDKIRELVSVAASKGVLHRDREQPAVPKSGNH
ncbi:MAG: helix-hairpin-helix domain-containing protein [Nitrospira sp.]|nr:helix-hairpin-helix domain-containing protein [Nitrospira sp.]